VPDALAGSGYQSRFSVGCSTYSPELPGVHVTIEVDPRITPSTDLVMRLSPRPASRPRATLSAGPQTGSACEGARGIRFTISGSVPAVLDLLIESREATVTVLRRGVPVIQPMVLKGLAPVTARVE
jgi:hypothetical protein